MSQSAEHIYTPAELNREVRLHLEAGFARIALEGEVSNLARPTSGHLYFTIKDAQAQVRCALFRSSANRVSQSLTNGQNVLARGRISLYEPRGDYQFIVDSLQEAGEGLLQRRFEELKHKLEAEGLFDPARKHALPAYPRRIALVTSASGAAVRDLLHVLKRRWPIAKVRLYPVPVQGVEAPPAICKALRAANRHAWADVLIVGRGGGSLEDLFAFNDEGVARAIRASDIPVVSAVGHETDFSISDFAADLRAPTPSAAAELATPDRAALRSSFSRTGRQIYRRMADRLMTSSQKLDHAAHRLQQQHPSRRLGEQLRRLNTLVLSLRRTMKQTFLERARSVDGLGGRLAAHQPSVRLAMLRTRLDAVRRSLGRQALRNLDGRRQRLRDLARTLNAVSPLEVIARGYAVLSLPDESLVISSVRQVEPGEAITARLKDGRLDCTVQAIR
ncbi:MAG: exodeoxyribonuclease VII large subunit [Lysobacterales bacterium]|jgi:exodeoxyribonuclease VII large subunit